MARFSPGLPLTEAPVERACGACVVLPARNEERWLGPALDRLAAQVEVDGTPLGYASYEVLLLLNNCTDGSAAVARAAQARHPGLRLHVVERTLPPASAHVGTARRLLMDTAWRRLEGSAESTRALLSTDADTLVARDWVAETMRAIGRGADAVGGQICWCEGEFAQLPAMVQTAYGRDHRYQQLLAEVEDAMDPRGEDPCPRHVHHFGASLACTPEAYARAGGLPPLRSLEDVALVRALRRTGARVRHEPRVRVYTSGRMDGRVEVGLSGQLRAWEEMGLAGTPQWVPSAAWWRHRLRLSRALRGLVRGEGEGEALRELPAVWRRRVRQVCGPGLRRHGAGERQAFEELLLLLPFDRLLEESFEGWGAEEITKVSGDLERELGEMRARAAGDTDAARGDGARTATLCVSG